MNRLDKLFTAGKGELLSVFFTAGYPGADDTVTILESLERHGADMVEIGMPFSDPVADGPVIQESNRVALENGTSIARIFSQVKESAAGLKIPVIMMGYFNPVLKFGIEKFCEACSDCGIDGVIIPDLPLREYEEKYREFFRKANLHFIMLVTPATSDARLKEIAGSSSGFIYALSSNSITGGREGLTETTGYIERVKEITGLPVMIGFGIHDNASFRSACMVADGAISGSAYIRALGEGSDIEKATEEFIRKLRGES